jgi:hypothetical protein
MSQYVDIRNMDTGLAGPGSQALAVVSGSLNWGRGKILRYGVCTMHDLGLDLVRVF